MKQTANQSVLLGLLMILGTVTIFSMVIAFLVLGGKNAAEILADKVADLPEPYIFGILLVLALAALGLIALEVRLISMIRRDTRSRSGKWGLNLRRVSCPRCYSQQPVIRYVTSWRQIWWGGQKCRACGSEMDKWGAEVVPSSRSV